MESRTFYVGPVQHGKESEMIAVLSSPCAGYEYAYEYTSDDDSEDAPAPNSTPSGTHNRMCDNLPMISHKNFNKHSNGFGIVDARNEGHPILRACNRKGQGSSPRGHRQQSDGKALTGGRTGTDIKKRIALLRCAGLCKGELPPLSSPRNSVKGLRFHKHEEKGDREPLLRTTRLSNTSESKSELPPPASPQLSVRGFRSPKHEEEGDREPPPPPAQGAIGSDPMFLKDFGWQGLNSNNNALRTLLEKDSRHHRRGEYKPDYFHSTLGQAIRVSTPKSPRTAPQPFDLAHDDNLEVDPIITARPVYRGLRVSPKEFPDPETFGWDFVGSCGERRVEFFEKDYREKGVVVLDFEYTTGTVRITLEHPVWGKSLLIFARGGSRVSPSGLSPKIYRKILIDPLGCSSARTTSAHSSSSK